MNLLTGKEKEIHEALGHHEFVVPYGNARMEFEFSTDERIWNWRVCVHCGKIETKGFDSHNYEVWAKEALGVYWRRHAIQK